ncbi:hypothetical protein B0H66DRAFT_490780, partial [Apodospora peruviana]
MSLQVDERSGRGRSRSRSPGGGRRRDPDEYDDRDRDRSRTRGGYNPNVVDAVPYPSSSVGGAPDSASTAYEYERLSSWPSAAAQHDDDDDDDYYRKPKQPPSSSREEYRYEKEQRGGGDRDSDREEEREKLKAAMFLPPKYRDAAAQKVTVSPTTESPRHSRDSLGGKEREKDRTSDRDSRSDRKERRKEKLEEDLAYGSVPGPSKHSSARLESPPTSYSYAQPKPYEYAKTEDHRYSTVDTLGPGRVPGRAPSPSGGRPPLKSAMKRERSPQPPVARMSSLSVNTGHHHSGSMSLSAAPPSPLLESYHGTWQSMPPMPSPLLLPTYGSNPFEAISPVASDDERGSGDKRRSRRARFHDPVDDATRLAKALKGERRAPDTEPLIEILPGLTHEQVMELRTEYKRLVKTGSDRKGVNIAKHIRARLKDEDPNLMKACYAVALGKWESEAYWANFWYHGDKTRRELLIEALMGRTNDEIREIKDGFSDKKYGNSLSKCMRQELKEDKFKKAVLMVLEEQRMEEKDGYGRPLRIDHDLVMDDVSQLHSAVRSDRGGESLMIKIVTQRSDGHLREVLRVYKETYRGANFAKDALKKSGNLVGEVLAHILNGVINKPVRDAMLLNHALTASKRDDLRKELLISRLVRYHWDGAHMAQVKKAYRDQYGKDLQESVREVSSGEWGEFCRALCITRMPDDVKKIARV